MRRIIEALAFMMIVLSSGAFIQQMKDGGAREQGLENTISYAGILNKIPFIWIACVFFIISILLINRNLKKIRFSWPLVSLIAYCFASTVWSEFPGIAFQSTLFISAAYLLVNTQITLYGRHRAIHFFSLTLLSILVCSCVAVLLVPEYGLSVGFEHGGKWQGVFDHKNGLGNFSAISFLIFSWQYQQKRSTLTLTAALLAAILAIGSQSGTAIFNILLVTFIFIFFHFQLTTKIIYYLRYFIIITLIFFSFLAIFIAINFEHFSIFEKDSSFTGRNLIWAYIIAKVGASPWFGYGLDQLGAITNKNSAEFFTNVGYLVGSAHNGFLETTFSLGLIGLILIFFTLIKQINDLKNNSDFNLIFSYITVFIITNTFEARMIGFNFYFIGLMYLMVIGSDMLFPPTNTSQQKVRPTDNFLNSIRTEYRN